MLEHAMVSTAAGPVSPSSLHTSSSTMPSEAQKERRRERETKKRKVPDPSSPSSAASSAASSSEDETIMSFQEKKKRLAAASLSAAKKERARNANNRKNPSSSSGVASPTAGDNTTATEKKEDDRNGERKRENASSLSSPHSSADADPEAMAIMTRKQLHNMREQRRMKKITDLMNCIRTKLIAAGCEVRREKHHILTETLEYIRTLESKVTRLEQQHRECPHISGAAMVVEEYPRSGAGGEMRAEGGGGGGYRASLSRSASYYPSPPPPPHYQRSSSVGSAAGYYGHPPVVPPAPLPPHHQHSLKHPAVHHLQQEGRMLSPSSPSYNNSQSSPAMLSGSLPAPPASAQGRHLLPPPPLPSSSAMTSSSPAGERGMMASYPSLSSSYSQQPFTPQGASYYPPKLPSIDKGEDGGKKLPSYPLSSTSSPAGYSSTGSPSNSSIGRGEGGGGEGPSSSLPSTLPPPTASMQSLLPPQTFHRPQHPHPTSYSTKGGEGRYLAPMSAKVPSSSMMMAGPREGEDGRVGGGGEHSSSLLSPEESHFVRASPLPSAICSLEDGTFLDCNKLFLERLGMDPASSLTLIRSESLFSLCLDGMDAKILSQALQSLKDGRMTVECQLTWRSARERPCRVRLSFSMSLSPRSRFSPRAYVQIVL